MSNLSQGSIIGRKRHLSSQLFAEVSEDEPASYQL